MKDGAGERKNLACGLNTVCLLVQGPEVLFAYWEISQVLWGLLTARGVFALRLMERHRDDRREVSFLFAEARPDVRMGDWYFRGVKPGCSYQVEAGCIDAMANGEARFFAYLHSEVVLTPHATISPEGRRRFARHRLPVARLMMDLPSSADYAAGKPGGDK